MAVRQVGQFTFDPETSQLTGPALYLQEQGNARLASILAGADPGFKAICAHAPNPDDVVGLVLVTLQTDYAGWAGMRQFNARLAR